MTPVQKRFSFVARQDMHNCEIFVFMYSMFGTVLYSRF